MSNGSALRHSVYIKPLHFEKQGHGAIVWPHYTVFVFSVLKVHALSYTLPEHCGESKHVCIITRATSLSVQTRRTPTRPVASSRADSTHILLTWTCVAGVICVVALELIPICVLFIYMSGSLISDALFLVRFVAMASSVFGVIAISQGFFLR